MRYATGNEHSAVQHVEYDNVQETGTPVISRTSIQ